jgi:5-methylcytosine-specific restriction protein B
MKGQTIEIILQNKVVPLLMEYFSGKTDIVSKIFADTNWNVTYDTTNFIWVISPR